MFSAYFLTCFMDITGGQQCAVYYTEMPEFVNTQGRCNQDTALMHQTSIDDVLSEFPELVLTKRENGCFKGALAAEEVARDEHAKLLNQGLPTVFGEIP